MNTTIIYRLISPVLFTRIEVPQKGTILELKKEIEKITKIPPKDQKIYFDIKHTKKITNKDNDFIKNLKLKEGEAIYLDNTPSKDIIQPKSENKCNHGANEVCINCIDSKKNQKKQTEPEKNKKNVNEELRKKMGLTEKCNHAPGQKCLYCIGPIDTKNESKFTCQHGEGGKCPNCVGKEFISDAKHISFDQYINEQKQKCKGTHEPTTVCINCMPPSQIIYKKKKNCNNHPPEHICNECMPPNVILNRQVYRHVDYVSFMNKEEIELFLQPWIKEFFQKQRMAYLFGYYAKDPNYPDGVRAVVEALYEPPQIGDIESVEPNPDKDIERIDRIAQGLTLECIGWIFTTLKEKSVALSSYDIRKAARYQQEYLINHPSGCKISRFITCVVKPNDVGDCEIEVYMVSDMCQALERDNIFDDTLKDKKTIQVRKPKKGEILPTIYMEGKPTNKFDPDFFIVNIAHGIPQNKKDQNILKTYDFPVAARVPKGIVTYSMVKNYFKTHLKDKPNIKCANLFFLLYLSKKIDVVTAENYAKQISEGKLDWDLLKEILSQIGLAI